MAEPWRFFCTIERVVDGDTVDVLVDLGFSMFHRTRVRLYGIDAPETRTKDQAEKERGLQSKAFVEEVLSVGHEFELLSYEVGKFGRCIGDFVLVGKTVEHPNVALGVQTTLSKELVRRGLAVEKDYG